MRNLLIILGVTLFVHGALSCRQGDDDVVVTPPHPGPDTAHVNWRFVGTWHEKGAPPSGCGDCDSVTFSMDGKLSSKLTPNMKEYRVASADSLEIGLQVGTKSGKIMRYYHFVSSGELFINDFAPQRPGLEGRPVYLVK